MCTLNWTLFSNWAPKVLEFEKVVSKSKVQELKNERIGKKGKLDNIGLYQGIG
jgi:hypothetical protein